jgi:hypothetical protein
MFFDADLPYFAIVPPWALSVLCAMRSWHRSLHSEAAAVQVLSRVPLVRKMLFRETYGHGSTGGSLAEQHRKIAEPNSAQKAGE